MKVTFLLVLPIINGWHTTVVGYGEHGRALAARELQSIARPALDASKQVRPRRATEVPR